MAIPYQIAKFKSANILQWAQLPNLIPANISGSIQYDILLVYSLLFITNRLSNSELPSVYAGELHLCKIS